MLRRFAAAFALVLLLVAPVSQVLAQDAPGCSYTAGFLDFYNLIPDVIGHCIANEHVNPDGVTVQQTANGMLAWKWRTQFTDGYRTWDKGAYLGPGCYVVRVRFNTQRFPDEDNPLGLPVTNGMVVSSCTGSSPGPQPAGAPAAAPPAQQSGCTVYSNNVFYHTDAQFTAVDPGPACNVVQNILQTTGLGGDPKIARNAEAACAVGSIFDILAGLGSSACLAAAKAEAHANWVVNSGYWSNDKATVVCRGTFRGASYAVLDAGSQYVGQNLCAWMQGNG